MTVPHLAPLTALFVIGVMLVLGGYVSSVTRVYATAVVSGQRRGAVIGALARPYHTARWLVGQQPVRTEHPDMVLWVVAPAAYLALAAVALMTVPLSAGVVGADLGSGIVVFGAAEALAIVAVFLHGWSPNSPLALVAGYRFVAVALSYELLSMFVLIAAAIPAESLSIGAIVESQHGLWNVVRQPLGLPLWLVVSWGVTFSGPLDLVDSAELAGGGAVDDSGVARLVWLVGRSFMSVTFAAAGAAVFLGGWQGPLLPGGVWMAAKTMVLLTVIVVGGVTLARLDDRRFVRLAWSVLLPLGFVDLLIAGVGSL